MITRYLSFVVVFCAVAAIGIYTSSAAWSLWPEEKSAVATTFEAVECHAADVTYLRTRPGQDTPLGPFEDELGTTPHWCQSAESVEYASWFGFSGANVPVFPHPLLIKIAVAGGENIDGTYIRGLRDAATQLSTIMSKQMQMIGLFFDAEHQLDTQRQIQELAAEAHKDYHPGEQLCVIGSTIRSLASADQRQQAQKQSLNTLLMQRYTSEEGGMAETGKVRYTASRLHNFKNYFCDDDNYNRHIASICTAPDVMRPFENADIDFTSMLDVPLTLNVDLLDGESQPDEEALVSMAANLYWSEGAPIYPADIMERDYHEYLDLRHMTAMSNVAHNSFASLVAAKSQAPVDAGITGGGEFMKAYLKQFGLDDSEVRTLLGENPSYYAQMDFFAGKMLQLPGFYTNLYDKPANVARMETSLQAIKNMQLRDTYKSAVRREMLYALLIEQNLKRHITNLNAGILN